MKAKTVVKDIPLDYCSTDVSCCSTNGGDIMRYRYSISRIIAGTNQFKTKLVYVIWWNQLIFKLLPEIRLSSDIDEQFGFWVSFLNLFISMRPVAERRGRVSLGLLISSICGGLSERLFIVDSGIQ